MVGLKETVPHTHQTVGGTVGSDTFLPSVSTDISSESAILRMASQMNIVNQYRNNNYLLDLVNNIPVSNDQRIATWWEEIPKLGGSATVAEGETKPITQYLYKLHMSEYKKEATLISFTDEFVMDFGRLQSEILNNGKKDLDNRLQSAILANILAIAIQFDPTGTVFDHSIPNANNYDVIAAMAAQVDNATYGGGATNAALMNTMTKHFMGITKNANGNYLNPPSSLDGISFIGNPEIGAQDVIVGDFKRYNVQTRGGIIVKVGYNGTDFAENKFSTVIERFYFDYISNIHKPSIVKSEFDVARSLIELADEDEGEG